ncbi:hypothetical protein BRADI_2g32930v3 [Brachypodium distachyon]|uniref:N-acetyltransferase domain-containing protein n=1 Tax=Brachypodium distachyon TaxID=15368 RepID=A0A2K2DBJ8_BRADI|nr:hypothetical protein BRADI_2g32930v3 [Brachypodium distachyon]
MLRRVNVWGRWSARWGSTGEPSGGTSPCSSSSRPTGAEESVFVPIRPTSGRSSATELVTRSIRVMMESGCEEVTLEAEVTNKGALALYGRLGFIRAKRLYRYYLNGVDAFRLKLLFPRLDLGLPPMMMGDERDDQLIDSPYL